MPAISTQSSQASHARTPCAHLQISTPRLLSRETFSHCCSVGRSICVRACTTFAGLERADAMAEMAFSAQNELRQKHA